MDIFDQLRKEFHGAVKQREEKIATIAPTRDELDRALADLEKAKANVAVVGKKWRQAIDEAGIFDLENFIAKLARSLEGKTGKQE